MPEYRCCSCRYAENDYEEYYGGYKRYFICGCMKNEEPDEFTSARNTRRTEAGMRIGELENKIEIEFLLMSGFATVIFSIICTFV